MPSTERNRTLKLKQKQCYIIQDTRYRKDNYKPEVRKTAMSAHMWRHHAKQERIPGKSLQIWLAYKHGPLQRHKTEMST